MNLNLESRGAPHIHYTESTRSLMIDALLTMVVIYAMAFYYYGVRVIVLGLVSGGAAVFTDIICILFAGRRPNSRDYSSLVTGLLIPLMMPASIPFSIVVIAALFAIIVAKAPFGGVGHNIFNPAASGLAFVTICFQDKLFLYPTPLEHLAVFPQASLRLVNSPSFTLKLDGVPKYDFVSMALGNFPGPMGATNILVILACLLYLVLRGTVRWKTPVFFFITAALLAFFFPRAPVSGFNSVLYEMMSGMILIGGVFMLGDPVTSPKRDFSQVAYAVVSGIIVMLFRHFGNLEEDFVFSILLTNAMVWGFDMLGESLSGFIRRRKV